MDKNREKKNLKKILILVLFINLVAADPNLFDYIIVNEELESAYIQFLNAIREDLEATKRK